MKTQANATTSRHKVASQEEWLAARLELLKAEKEHTRRGDVDLVKLDLHLFATMTQGALAASSINQDAAHCLRGGREEMSASGEIWILIANHGVRLRGPMLWVAMCCRQRQSPWAVNCEH